MDDNLEKLLYDFEIGSSEKQHSTFRSLIALRLHHKAVTDSRFKIGLKRMQSVAADNSSSQNDRLLALATLARIAATVKSLRTVIFDEFQQLLVEPLPIPSILCDVDDRNYIGQACAAASHGWIKEYAAKAIIYEESGEQARQSFFAALVKSTDDLETAFRILSQHLHSWVPETEDPGSTVARRLRRILSAARAIVLETMPEPGDEPGEALSKLITAAFAGVASIANFEVLGETSEELAGVVHEIVRLRFSLAMKASTYSSLGVMQELFPRNLWLKVTAKSRSLATVASDICEAILVLSRQGVTDSALVRQLSTAVGNNELARTRLKELAKKTGLSPEVRTWLAEGKLEAPKTIGPEAGESRKLSDDALLADLLVDSLRFRISEETGRQQILPEFEILNPTLANEVKRLMNYALGLCDAVAVIAKRRGLKLRGAPGDEEDFSPLDHEVVGAPVGVRRVRVIRPVVEQIREDGIPFVIRKGLVEPLK